MPSSVIPAQGMVQVLDSSLAASCLHPIKADVHSIPFDGQPLMSKKGWHQAFWGLVQCWVC